MNDHNTRGLLMFDFDGVIADSLNVLVMHEAHAAGVRAIAVLWGWHGEERLLPGLPDRLLHSPADLLALCT